MSSVEQGLGASLVVGGDNAGGGGGNLFPVANAASIFEFFAAGSGSHDIIARPTLGNAAMCITLAALNTGAGNVAIEVVNFNAGPVVTFDLAVSNVPKDILGNCPDLLTNYSGPLSVKVFGAGTGAYFFGQYVSFAIGSHDIREGYMEMTTAFQTVPNIVPSVPNVVSVPFTQPWAPGLPTQLGFHTNNDASANQIQFRITRGATVAVFNAPSCPSLTRTPFNPPFPGLVQGDIVEAKLLLAETNVGQNWLAMINEVLPVP